ncbi:PQQ-dependent sugar dehydrogenase [uncultured Roseivirga sp.]|uniref:PQQ-dependent sugar dehydrogenase n=1 Tax=uncultured Roseivirga sp. TaxID=543088 RepID=UPI0030DA6399|tara:strand:+ start:125396 stop:126529 length:1134 start_codon:yes stop_codon:yes gene_type:complete
MSTIKPLFALALFFTFSCDAQTTSGPIEITEPTQTSDLVPRLVTDELSNPWGMVFLPDGKILVTEKAGTIVLIENDRVVNKEVSGGPQSTTRGQGGLLDIELHPDFDSNKWVYFTFASAEGEGDGAMTALSRAKWNGSSFDGHEVLYKGSPNTRAGQHFGSRIAFDAQNHVYFSIGDRGNRDVNPQDITRDGGKVYRLNDDGSIPSDNPFVNTANAKTAIYSYGHRNPQGLATNPETGDIWEHEHGPQGGDEVNIIGKGKNYGWPVITYGENYGGGAITDKTAMEGMEQPVTYWVPSIAPCGMAFVQDAKYTGWDGDLIVGSLKFSYLVRCVIENDKVVRQEKIAEGIGRVRNVEMGNDGYLYVGVEGKGLYRLVQK